MNTVIFIGGATASGKSSLAKELNKSIENSILYRRFQGFFDMANLYGIKENEIFDKVSTHEVDDWFVKKCQESEFIISDVHYAVQLNRDSKNNEVNVDIYKEYVPTISQELLNELLSKGIGIIAIYLSCSPDVCFRRATLRFNNNEKELRTKSLEDAYLESQAEYREWCSIVGMNAIIGVNFDSERLTTLELASQFLEMINSPKKNLLLQKKRKNKDTRQN